MLSFVKFLQFLIQCYILKSILRAIEYPPRSFVKLLVLIYALT